MRAHARVRVRARGRSRGSIQLFRASCCSQAPFCRARVSVSATRRVARGSPRIPSFNAAAASTEDTGGRGGVCHDSGGLPPEGGGGRLLVFFFFFFGLLAHDVGVVAEHALVPVFFRTQTRRAGSRGARREARRPVPPPPWGLGLGARAPLEARRAAVEKIKRRRGGEGGGGAEAGAGPREGCGAPPASAVRPRFFFVPIFFVFVLSFQSFLFISSFFPVFFLLLYY